MHGPVDAIHPGRDDGKTPNNFSGIKSTIRAKESGESIRGGKKFGFGFGTAGSTGVAVDMDGSVVEAQRMDKGSHASDYGKKNIGSGGGGVEGASSGFGDREQTRQSDPSGNSGAHKQSTNGDGQSDQHRSRDGYGGHNGTSSKKSNSGKDNGENGSKSTGESSSAPPPPPVLKGTLSYNLEHRRHVIRGMWNYENSNAFPPQRFELVRNLNPVEDPKELPKDGEFHGSFSLAYYHTTSKGKQKERSRVISENGVKIKFTPIEGASGEYNVDGQGTNQFGIFNINGTATPSQHKDDPSFNILLRKRYLPSQMPSAASSGTNTDSKKTKKQKKRKHNLVGTAPNGDTENAADMEEGPLPPPSQSYPSHVVCLRGKLNRDQSEYLGETEVVHRINGMWSSGLDLILADPQNVRGLCNRFEYEHKSTLPNNTFPVSGRYSGWFDLTNEDGSKTRIAEKDITLKFRKNNAGYHNVEGRGSNAFGKYNITGTLTQDNVITIFRHFQSWKPKSKDTSKNSTAAQTGSTPATASGNSKNEPPPLPALQIKLDEVMAPSDKEAEQLPPTEQPAHGAYSAISRGILRLNDDGAHTCNGRWAITREHFNNGTTSNFAFRLEAHFAAQSAAAMKRGEGDKADGKKETSAVSSASVSLSGAPSGSTTFPIDSALYKGSFQMKRGANKYTSVIDQQIVLKFRKNSKGSFNVYGKGINTLGVFNLIGTFITTGTTSGHVELYRIYLPSPGSQQPTHQKPSQNKVTGSVAAKAVVSQSTVPDDAPESSQTASAAVPTTTSSSTTGQKGSGVAPPSAVTSRPPQLVRRESSRLVKLPSRLEDDDPNAQLSRLVEKCGQVLKFIREKDAAESHFFANPVDPVAQRIPTYHQVISEPMDLGTIQSKFDANEISSPEEFGRLVRLTFENAMTFNVEPAHVVHQAARRLLILFNQKFRDIERTAENIRRTHKLPDAETQRLKEEAKKAKKKGKDDKKRKSPFEEGKTPKRARLEEAQAMAAANANSIAALAAAAPQSSSTGVVSRAEFNMMVQMIQQLQNQVVQTFTLLANMSPDDATEEVPVALPLPTVVEPPVVLPEVVNPPVPAPAPTPAPEKKRPQKKTTKAEEKQASVAEEEKPLTLKEQEVLTETINSLPQDKLHGVIGIIQESSTQLQSDEDEIDLEIDLLNTVTQRKLQRYVMKFAKPSRRQKSKPVPRKKPAAAPTQTAAPSSLAPPKKTDTKPKPAGKKAQPQPAPEAKPGPDSFFAFVNKEESDTESEGEVRGEEAEASTSKPADDSQFNLGDGFGETQDENDDDDIGSGGFGTNWSIAKPDAGSNAKDVDDDDWGAAKKEAEVAKAREAERKAREDKLRAEAEQAKNQRLLDAVSRGDKIRSERMEEEAQEARLREQKEREAEQKRKEARDRTREKLEAVEQTVDLDEQRNIMKEFESSYMGDEDGASPSSDFGF